MSAPAPGRYEAPGLPTVLVAALGDGRLWWRQVDDAGWVTTSVDGATRYLHRYGYRRAAALQQEPTWTGA